MNYEATDVVFVVEKSITLRHYLDELIESYISPTISFFSGGISEENDVFFTQSSVVQYSLVFYGTEFSILGSCNQLETQGPTTSQLSILNAIRDANYSYKNTCRQAYILEALQTAVEVFKALSSKSKCRKENVKRYLVLVTQSSPIFNSWTSSSPESIIQDLKTIGVKTSIISAHKLSELYSLFEDSGGDMQSIAAKNYASRPQHLVLLNGFSLQERALSPSLMNQASTTTLSNGQTPSVPSSMSNMPCSVPSNQVQPVLHNASVAPSMIGPPSGHVVQPLSHQNQIPNQPHQPQQLNQMNVQRQGLMNPTPSQPAAVSQTQPPGGMVRTSVTVMQNSGANVMNTRPNRWPVGNGSMMMQNAQPNMQVPQQMQPTSLQNQPQNHHMVQVPMQGNQIMGGGMNTQGPMTTQGPMNPQVNQPRTVSPTIIWQGTLEWSEKKHLPGGGNGLQRIPCKISSTPMNGKLEIKTDGWPSTLQMLLVQKNLLSSVGNTYFQNIHKVMFYPDPCPALDSLTASLSQGFAGCVHLSSSSSDVKMIILLFSPDKRAYVGFIPLDQAAFVSKIKQVFQNQSRNMQSQAMNKQPNAPNTMIPNVNPQAGVSTQNMQLMNNQNMNVSQPNMMIQPQQSQMNAPVPQQGNMGGNNSMTTGPVSQVGGGNQVNQMNPNQGQISMGPSQPQSMNMPTHVTQGASMVSQMGVPNQNVMGNRARPPMNIGNQQQPTDQMQMRQAMHPNSIRHQIQMQSSQQQRGPGMQVNMGQPRVMTTQMRQILQQQRLQQQQHQQQQQMFLIQQQNMRPQMNQAQAAVMAGQQGMSQQQMSQQNIAQQQAMGQQGVNQQPGLGQQQPGLGQQQPGMGQQQPGLPQQQQPGMAQQQPGMGQQGLNQSLNQGMGQPMQDNPTDYLDLV